MKTAYLVKLYNAGISFTLKEYYKTQNFPQHNLKIVNNTNPPRIM